MNCRVCDSKRLDLAIDLGLQPWANHFLKKNEVGKEPLYPLRVVYCHDCKTAQLDYTVKKEVMFGDHTYLSGVTKTLKEHFKKTAEEVDSRFFKNIRKKSILDIGSNDGAQLRFYKDLGYDVLGIESSKTIAKLANETGINTLNEFFNFTVARNLRKKFNIINASGVFFHLEELHSVTDGVRETLEKNGIFVVQFLYMKSIVENLAFDQIYHEHLLYYNLQTIDVLLNRHGLSLFDAYLSPIHGGSIIGFACHQGGKMASKRLAALKKDEIAKKSNSLSTYIQFAHRVGAMREKYLRYLNHAKTAKKRVFGFGAPVKGNTLLNYCEIGTKYLDCLVEKNELRRGLYSPGMHIPIAIERELKELPDIYFVLAWNFKNEILSNNKKLIDAGIEFYFPVNPKIS